MMDFVINFKFNSLLGIILYWIPLSLCAFGYTMRTGFNYQKDLDKRSESYYVPTDTIGTLIGRAIICLLPIANLWAALFDVAPMLFGRFFTFFDKLLNQPLVPRRKESE